MGSWQTAALALTVLGGGDAETVLLDFYADSCISCRRMEPAIEQLAAAGYPVRRVNVNQYPALADRYGVNLLPSFVMLSNGRAIDGQVGETTFQRLEEMCRAAGSGRSNRQLPLPAGAGAGWVAGAGPPIPEALPRSDEPQRGPAAGLDSPVPGHGPASGWRLAGPRPVSSPASPTPTVDRLIAATVWLRVQDAKGQSCGSGTIIDARGDEALILTCGHVFREFQGRGIEVTLFGPRTGETIAGHLLHYDLKRDLGLLKIKIAGPVTTVRVAPAGYQAAPGARVINVGCAHGEPPTARLGRIIAVDKFLGPPNLQVSGLPVQGRSGGGLVSSDGWLIGVCNAADPLDSAGLYAALPCIQTVLAEAGLASVYGGQPRGAAVDGPLVAVDPPPVPKRMPRPSDLTESSVAAAAPSGRQAAPVPADRLQPLSGQEQAALQEILARTAGGDEVVCIIRSRSNPQAPSEILVLDHVSAAFLKQLAAAARADTQASEHLTSLELPRGLPTPQSSTSSMIRGQSPSKPLLEYDATVAKGRPTSRQSR